MSETQSNETQSKVSRTPRGRSPGYPAIDLQAAIKRAETLYQHEKMHSAPIGAIVGHWGYKSPTSGVAAVQYASLKKFGLLTEEGSGNNRQGKLTGLAYSILHNPDEDERIAAIHKAALNPPIHREMWNLYGSDLPSNANLRYRLITERGFTEAGAEDFVNQYKATIAFAMKYGELQSEQGQWDTEDMVEADEPEHVDVPDQRRYADPARHLRERGARQQMSGFPPRSQQQQPPAHPVHGTRIPIPLIGGQQIIIEGEFPITEAAWANFQAVLQAFKPGLVIPNPESVQPSIPAEFLQSDTYANDDEDNDLQLDRQPTQ